MTVRVKPPEELLPLFVADRDIARLLGQSLGWLKANVASLEATTGFPKIDPVIGLRHREAVEEWARERNQRAKPHSERQINSHKEDHSAF